jgi:hypothetical protein
VCASDAWLDNCLPSLDLLGRTGGDREMSDVHGDLRGFIDAGIL